MILVINEKTNQLMKLEKELEMIEALIAEKRLKDTPVILEV